MYDFVVFEHLLLKHGYMKLSCLAGSFDMLWNVTEKTFEKVPQ